MAIDSFQFVHYGTVIKNDFCQLSLLQHVQSSFCNGAMPNIVFFVCFFLCFISGIEEEGEKTWLPCFPGSFLVLLPVYWNVFMEIIGEMMV